VSLTLVDGKRWPQLAAMIQYTEDWLILTLLQIEGSVFPRALLFALPSAVLAALLVHVRVQLPELAQELDQVIAIEDTHRSQLWTAAVGVLSGLLIFRVNQAMTRFWEGTGLLHQMRGEWFEAVNASVAFSSPSLAKRPEETLNFRHTIVRLMSLCHGSALCEIGGNPPDDCWSIDVAGLDAETLQHLKACVEVYGFKHVEAILHLIQSLVTANLASGVLKIAPPILTRVYQNLSRGFVNLLNAKKIADTRFPFPYVQLISFFLLVNMVLTPLMISACFTKVWMAVVFAFIPIFGLSCLNLICIELENPFGNDPNDLPLHHFQEDMNNCLIVLLHESADLMPGIDSKRCLMTVAEIRRGLRAETKNRTSVGGRQAMRLSDWKTARISKFDEIIGEEFGEGREGDDTEDLRQEESNSLSDVAAEAIPEGEAKVEDRELLKPELFQQGIEHIADVLSEIKEAVAAQATQVGDSVDAFKTLAMKIDLLERGKDGIAEGIG